MTKYTPAPWTHDHGENDMDWKITVRGKRNDFPDDDTVFVLDYNSSGEETEANARLIAKAPETKQQRDDLLKALQLLMDAFIHIDGNVKGNKAKTDIITLNPEVGDALNVAQAAINKATS